MPGTYTLSMRLNEHGISDQEISFLKEPATMKWW
jgi:hypothetical protein